MKQPKKILAIKLRAIGDTVIWTSALQLLRDSFPEAEVHTLTYASNAAVLKDHPAAKFQHYLKGHTHLELLKMLWSLRRERFAWLLGFHATTSLCRWAWLTGASKVALHHHSWARTPRGSVPVPHAAELEDAITRDSRVIEAMGLKVGRPKTRIFISSFESDASEALVRARIVQSGGDIKLPRYLFLPGAGHKLRRLAKDMWLPLAEKMLFDKRYQPMVVVDEALSKELGLREDCQRLGLPLFDQGNLREFMALVSRGERALANDSGPGHIAVALGLKTSFVFGPGCGGDWHPYDKREHPLFRVDVPCRAEGPRDREQFQYCTLNECSHHRCMREQKIDIQQLMG